MKFDPTKLNNEILKAAQNSRNFAKQNSFVVGDKIDLLASDSLPAWLKQHERLIEQVESDGGLSARFRS